jgi:phage-related protein
MINNYLIFDSNSIADIPGIQLTVLNPHNMARREVARKRIPRANKSKVVNSEFTTKVIPVVGTLSGASLIEFQQRRDLLKKYLLPTEGVLSVMEAGEVRNYLATVDVLTWTENLYGLMGEFRFDFISSVPYGEASDFVTARNVTGITSADSTNGIGTILGSYETPTKITVTFNSVSGGTSKYFKITNPATGKYVQINSTFAAADVFIIDATTLAVTKNGVAIDFAGVLLEYEPGAASVRYQDNITTARNVDVKVEYKQRDA